MPRTGAANNVAEQTADAHDRRRDVPAIIHDEIGDSKATMARPTAARSDCKAVTRATTKAHNASLRNIVFSFI
jgi:hypothetical protein